MTWVVVMLFYPASPNTDRSGLEGTDLNSFGKEAGSHNGQNDNSKKINETYIGRVLRLTLLCRTS